ncbi:hypothetical protein CY0110_31385 [Crocosphaera chwakensis CCY0110]|uniref:Uncharacterized protein n=2 Tax=Crocosphaera TaxID=263510 RepID=A3IY24_9CHRO|nr:hypothetical protein CY0110_31385 [Crocosphaera chwakensis CCY0110]
MILEIFLFIVIFCFYCCLVPTTSTVEQDSFDNFIPSIKKAFSEEFDPTPETIEKNTNLKLTPQVSLSQTYHSNSDNLMIKPTSIVPKKSKESTNLSANLESLTYKELKEFVKTHNLQSTVRNICNKPYNRCKKKELIEVLKA